jgi:CHASE1-domain containing sensor protein
MKNDYPNANARLAEVAKSWAEGEVSHDEWRKERRSVIASLLSSHRDWLSGENRTLPPKRAKTINSTLPTIKVPPNLLAGSDAQVSVLLTAEVEATDDDVLLLALLLLVMILTAILLLYVM